MWVTCGMSVRSGFGASVDRRPGIVSLAVARPDMDRELEALISSALQRPHFEDAGPDGFAKAKDIVQPLQATLEPHRGHVFLDRVGHQQYIVTHTVTNEKHLFGGCQYTLEFDDEGFGALTPINDDKPVTLVEDLFRFVLYRDDNGDFIITASDKQGPGSILRLSDFSAKFSAHKLELKVGATRAPKVLDLVIFKWPRTAGAQIMFCAKSVYDELGLSQFSGASWRWISGSWRRWQTSMLNDFGLGDHVLPSTLMKELVAPQCDQCVWLAYYQCASWLQC